MSKYELTLDDDIHARFKVIAENLNITVDDVLCEAFVLFEKVTNCVVALDDDVYELYKKRADELDIPVELLVNQVMARQYRMNKN